MRGAGAECAVGSCTSGGDDAPAGVDLGPAGSVEGSDFNEVVPPVSVFEEKTVRDHNGGITHRTRLR